MIMDISFEPAAEAVLRDVGAAAAHAGAEAWAVGGVVRDAVLAHPNKDVDVTVRGDAAAVARALRDAWGAEMEGHAAFSTATLRRADGFLVDVVRARSETYPVPGALPVITPDGLEADLRRRDFSVNAMAASLGTDGFGTLVDPLGGRDDLLHRRLRILHAGSFVDDPTRLFRAARYATRYDLRPDDATEAAARAAVAHGALGTVSRDRLRREVERACEERHWAAALAWLNAWGIWEALAGAPAAEIFLRRADTTLAWAARSVSEPLPDIATFRFLIFLASQPPTLWENLAVKPAEAALVENARGRLLALVAGADTPAAWRVMDAAAMPDLLLALCLARTDAEKTRLTRYLTEIRPVELAISGEDMLAAGAVPGRALGAALRETLDAVRLGRVTGAAAERDYALRVWKEWNAHLSG
jgi:tRNA nucleotidyltransferase (CCA-adding enzyme)